MILILIKIEKIESLKEKVLLYVSGYLDMEDKKELYSKISAEFKVLRPILNKLNEKYPKRFHGESYLEYCREFDEFYDLVVTEINNNPYNYGETDERGYFTSFFNQYANFMENQSIEIELIPVKMHLSNQLTLDNVRDILNECDLHIHNGSYGAAITMAKTLLEGVFKEIIRTESPELLEVHQDFPVLKKKAFEIIELSTNNEAYDKDLKKLVGNISTIADTVNSIRNKVGIGHEAIDKANLSHALLVVNAAKTVTTFVLQTFDERNKRVRELINEYK